MLAVPGYDPSVFTRVTSLEAAKRIILTPGPHLPTEQRWQYETPYLCDLITNQMPITADTVVMDYGCGVGRIPRELIERHRCLSIGVDISPNMLGLAASYVNSDRFMGCSPAMADMLKLKADIVIAVWSLQHIPLLSEALSRIEAALFPSGGWLFVVNDARRRFIPDGNGKWFDDGIDVRGQLGDRFRLVADGDLDRDDVGDVIAERSFWAAYCTKGTS